MSSMQELPPLGFSPVPAGLPAHDPAPAHLRLVPDVPLDFDAAVRSITPRLQRYAARRLGDAHEAEELVQEALLRAYKNRDELLTEDDLAAWSTVVVGRLVIDRLRVRGRSVNCAEVPEGRRVGRDTAEVVVARDEARTALDALDAMPARQAAVLWAREVEGMAYDEIGLRFGMTEPAVRSLLTRARKALRKEYATRGGTLPVAGLSALAPWVVGLRWADRLRGVATRAAAPAAIGALGLGLVGGALYSPLTAPALQQPALEQSVLQQSVVVPVVADLAGRPAAAVAAPARVAGTTSRALPAAPRTRTLAEDRVRLGCDAARTGYAGNERCVNGTDRTSTIYVGPTLPDNPTGIRDIGIKSEKVDCSAVPSTPATTCSEDPSTGGTR
ncbi:MAG: polymerase sigma factor [Frankiales bacterium]|nr:polymerase sigma factor [Frankiales bacterium]